MKFIPFATLVLLLGGLVAVSTAVSGWSLPPEHKRVLCVASVAALLITWATYRMDRAGRQSQTP